MFNTKGDEKYCNGCRTFKPLEEFSSMTRLWVDRADRHGLRARCKTCRAAAEALRREQRRQQDEIRYRADHAAAQRRWRMKKARASRQAGQ